MSAAFPLHRTIAPLKERSFDLLVIGGGIYGAWTAYDAALRGLSVALIEKHDWAAGTSSASSKLIHGGLRYLEHYDFKLVRDALVERRQLHRLAPHLVRPLNFVMPVWKGPRATMFMLSAGLTLYDTLGGFGQPVDRHRRYSRKALLQRFPYVDPERLLGGFRYGDCQEDDARMTLTVVAAAQAAGAVVANRLGAEHLLREDGAVTGARVRDALSDDAFDLRARVTVNAAGPWAPKLLGADSPPMRRVKGIHILLPAIPGCEDAFLLTAQDGRVFFVIPWYGRTLVGTTEQEVADLDEVTATDDEVRYLLAGVRNGLPGLPWTEADVISRFAGVRSLQAEQAPELAAVTREFMLAEPVPHLLMPLGGKFTTARCDADEIVTAVQKRLGVPASPCRTGSQPLPGSPQIDQPFAAWHGQVTALLRQRGIDEASARMLTYRHGTRVTRIAELVDEEPSLRERLHPGTAFIKAEAVLAVRDEMAWTLEDVIRRRVPLALMERLGGEHLRSIAQLLSYELRRDAVEILEEYRRTRARAG